jgi:hypothetical protein
MVLPFYASGLQPASQRIKTLVGVFQDYRARNKSHRRRHSSAPDMLNCFAARGVDDIGCSRLLCDGKVAVAKLDGDDVSCAGENDSIYAITVGSRAR